MKIANETVMIKKWTKCANQFEARVHFAKDENDTPIVMVELLKNGETSEESRFYDMDWNIYDTMEWGPVSKDMGNEFWKWLKKVGFTVLKS